VRKETHGITQNKMVQAGTKDIKKIGNSWQETEKKRLSINPYKFEMMLEGEEKLMMMY
jgi:hypothetical protein